jgi:predicted RNA binding protein YcfA (HicA-like mRNA interferase family)
VKYKGAEVGELGNISGKNAVKAFERAGWSLRGQVGSHVMMTKEGMRVNLSVRSTKSFPQVRSGNSFAGLG